VKRAIVLKPAAFARYRGLAIQTVSYLGLAPKAMLSPAPQAQEHPIAAFVQAV